MSKKVILFVLNAVLIVQPFLVAETVSVDSVSTSPSFEDPATNPFRFVASNDGTLATKPGTVFTEGGDYEGLVLPYLVSTPKPIRYPRWAIRQGRQGKLLIALEIMTDGSVGRMKVMKSTGHEVLDEIGQKAVATWQFHPAMRNGKPEHTCIQIPIVFELENA